MRILAIGDTADNIFTLKKFTKRSSIHLITFPRKEAALLTNSDQDIEFFDSLLVSKQIKKIKQIKNNYDLCLVVSWAAARIAYLAGLNYMMYFVGSDATTPPFIRNPKDPYLNEPVYNRNWIERRFYRKVFDAAIVCIAGALEYEALKKYRKDIIRMDRGIVDKTLFNETVKPIELPKKKFIFLSAQRIGMEKGFDVIWNALRLCKTDFEVLQVEWFIERTLEEKEFNKKLLENVPPQIRFIPLIKRVELARYFTFADAILGQMRAGIQGAIERDASFCKKPVLCYTDPSRTLLLNGKEVHPPFLPKSTDPEELANLIDRVVESKEFRDEIAIRGHTYIKELSDPENVIEWWERLFEDLIKKHQSINRKTHPIKIKVENLIAGFLEKYYYSKIMREKNIKAWGKEQYEKLTN